MEFDHTMITDDVLALYNARFVNDTSNDNSGNTTPSLANSWNIISTDKQHIFTDTSSISLSSQLPSLPPSFTSTTLPVISFSEFDRNPLTLLINYNNSNILQDKHIDKGEEIPMYQQVTLDKDDFILYLPENMMKVFNYTDWDKLLEMMNTHAYPNLITTYRSWHGMKMIGIDTYMRYLKTLTEAKPDIVQILNIVKTVGNVIEAKVSWNFTDCYDIHEQLYQSNHSQDVLTSNTTCARTLRLLPQMDLKKKSSVEIQEILDLLESKEDLFVTGVNYMQFIVDSNTHKVIQICLDPHILSINVKPKVII